MTDATTASRRPSLRRTVSLSIALVAIDAFLLNQGGLALVSGAWLLLVSMPRAMLLKRFAGTRAERARNIGIGLAAVALVFLLNAANNGLARSRAQSLVTAIEAFHAAEKRYPSALPQLVPRYAPEVPVAKYTLLNNEFVYRQTSDDAMLMYVALPPFGRPTYRFKDRRWSYVD